MKDSNPRSAFGTSCAYLIMFVRFRNASLAHNKKIPLPRMTEGLAAGEGFEPSQTESESGVLPLHKPAKRKSYYTRIKQIVKAFLKYFHKKIYPLHIIRPVIKDRPYRDGENIDESF